MKKFIILFLMVMGIFIVKNKNIVSWVSKNFNANPKPYYQQRLEFFEKVSNEYYGVADYAKELEVVNRNFQQMNTSLDRTELIIPSLDVIDRLKQRQTVLSLESDSINELTKGKEQQLRRATGVENETVESGKTEIIKSSIALVLFSVVIFSGLISLISYLLYRRKRRPSSWLLLPDENESIITDDRILLDFDPSGFDMEKKKMSTYT